MASGAAISHSPFFFFSVVVSPEAACTSISSNLDESAEKTFSFFGGRRVAGGLPLRLDEVDVRAQPERHHQENQK